MEISIVETRQEIERLRADLNAAGNICHQMKQPLMIIMGFLDLLSMETLSDTGMDDKLNKIRSQVNRLSELTNNLMNHTKK